MFACCNFCYVKYLNEDGSMNYDVYFDEVEKYVAEMVVLAKQRLKEGKGLKYRGIPEIMFDPDRICKCDCHIKGTQVMH